MNTQQQTAAAAANMTLEELLEFLANWRAERVALDQKIASADSLVASLSAADAAVRTALAQQAEAQRAAAGTLAALGINLPVQGDIQKPAQDTRPLPTLATCPDCGADVAEGDARCTSCGAAMVAATGDAGGVVAVAPPAIPWISSLGMAAVLVVLTLACLWVAFQFEWMRLEPATPQGVSGWVLPTGTPGATPTGQPGDHALTLPTATPWADWPIAGLPADGDCVLEEALALTRTASLQQGQPYVLTVARVGGGTWEEVTFGDSVTETLLFMTGSRMGLFEARLRSGEKTLGVRQFRWYPGAPECPAADALAPATPRPTSTPRPTAGVWFGETFTATHTAETLGHDAWRLCWISPTLWGQGVLGDILAQLNPEHNRLPPGATIILPHGQGDGWRCPKDFDPQGP